MVSFWYVGLMLFGTVGAMLGMGMGPTVTTKTISLLLIIACSLLGLMGVFLHFSKKHTDEQEEEQEKRIKTLEKALCDAQERMDGVQSVFQTTINNLVKEMRIWEKKFEESQLPAPTNEELRQVMREFETPPTRQIKIWERFKALPFLKKSP